MQVDDLLEAAGVRLLGSEASHVVAFHHPEHQLHPLDLEAAGDFLLYMDMAEIILLWASDPCRSYHHFMKHCPVESEPSHVSWRLWIQAGCLYAIRLAAISDWCCAYCKWF